jgi:hypothetical protein
MITSIKIVKSTSEHIKLSDDEERENMADRKQFLNPRPADPELLRLLEASKDHPVTEDDLREQRISFAFGNAPASNLITKETVRRASEKIKLR